LPVPDLWSLNFLQFVELLWMAREAKPEMTKTETYEEWAKVLFVEQPTNMKLQVVVDKLLMDFDAPPCNLYTDKSMQDHGLFQAICRVNRRDGKDKDFGYIVHYKDLFKKVENAISVCTSELDRSAGGVDPEILLQDRLKKGRERLDCAIETLTLLCEPVQPPKANWNTFTIFCETLTCPSGRGTRRAARWVTTSIGWVCPTQ
jgi:type I restriction enzyme, R subunit